MKSLITLYTQQELQSNTPLPDRNGISSASTYGITVTNISPYTLVVELFPGGKVVVQPFFLADIPILPNTPWRVYDIAGIADQLTPGQGVKLAESSQPISAGTMQVTSPVNPTTFSQMSVIYAGPAGSQTTAFFNSASALYGYAVSAMIQGTTGSGRVVFEFRDKHAHSVGSAQAFYNAGGGASFAVAFPRPMALPFVYVGAETFDCLFTVSDIAPGGSHAIAITVFYLP